MHVLSKFIANSISVGDGFCDYTLSFESPDDRGRYNWSETEVGRRDEQDCFYGSIVATESGRAVRTCRVRGTWENLELGKPYDGARNECITRGTFLLRQLAEVGMCPQFYSRLIIMLLFFHIR